MVCNPQYEAPQHTDSVPAFQNIYGGAVKLPWILKKTKSDMTWRMLTWPITLRHQSRWLVKCVEVGTNITLVYPLFCYSHYSPQIKCNICDFRVKIWDSHRARRCQYYSTKTKGCLFFFSTLWQGSMSETALKWRDLTASTAFRCWQSLRIKTVYCNELAISKPFVTTPQ